MILVQTNISADLSLDRILERTQRPKAIMQAAARGGRKVLRRHFRDRNKEPNKLGGRRTNFWLDVYKSTQIGEVTDRQGTIHIGDHRFALKVFGGKVQAKEQKNLTVPTSAEAHGRRVSVMQRETGIKLFRIKRQKKGKRDLLAELDGDKIKVHYVLVPKGDFITQRPDPQALPDPNTFGQAVTDAAVAQLEAELQAASGTSPGAV